MIVQLSVRGSWKPECDLLLTKTCLLFFIYCYELSSLLPWSPDSSVQMSDNRVMICDLLNFFFCQNKSSSAKLILSSSTRTNIEFVHNLTHTLFRVPPNQPAESHFVAVKGNLDATLHRHFMTQYWAFNCLFVSLLFQHKCPHAQSSWKEMAYVLCSRTWLDWKESWSQLGMQIVTNFPDS